MPRTLIFPANRKVGTLHRCENGPPIAWFKQFADAQGEVAIEDGVKVSLRAFAEWEYGTEVDSRRLSYLEQLPPDAIACIDLTRYSLYAPEDHFEALQSQESLIGLACEERYIPLLPLPVLKRIQQLELHGCDNELMIDYIAKMDDLNALCIWRASCNDEGLSSLERLQNLQYLILDDNVRPVGGHGLANLNADMRSFSIGWLDHDESSWLSRYQSLRNVHGTWVTDAHMEKLKDCRKMRSLFLSESRVTDTGFLCMSEMTELKMLYADRLDITDAALLGLANMQQLETLSLSNTKIKGHGLHHISSLQRLEEFTLGGCLLEHSAIESIARMPALKTVRLNGCDLRACALKDLADSQSLEKVIFLDAQINEDDVASLKSMETTFEVCGPAWESRSS